jgi:hypothetical protein
VTLDLIRDPEKDVRASALGALWLAEAHHPDEACRAWRDNLDNAQDDELAARANDYLTWSGHCQAYFDALLDSEEKRFKAGRTSQPLFAKALGNLCEDVKATSTQKARATELLKRIAEQKTSYRLARGAALEAVLRCDLGGGRAFVQKLADDDDPYVKERAMDLLRPKK